MKIVDIEVIELRVPGWKGDSFDGSYDNCVVLVHIGRIGADNDLLEAHGVGVGPWSVNDGTDH